jgi:hypothetical protein
MAVEPVAHPPPQAAPVPCRALGLGPALTTIHLAPPKPWGESQRTLCGLTRTLVAVTWSGPTCAHCRRLVGLDNEWPPPSQRRAGRRASAGAASP